MQIFEVVDPDSQKLLALSQFLLGRADDTTANKQISQAAFMDLAKSLGVNVTPDNLNQLISREPLKNILEPIEPGTGVVRFKGNIGGGGGMTVDQAQSVVNQNAKAALKRRQ
jgi:type 1 glutamine amidotransferase